MSSLVVELEEHGIDSSSVLLITNFSGKANITLMNNGLGTVPSIRNEVLTKAIVSCFKGIPLEIFLSDYYERYAINLEDEDEDLYDEIIYVYKELSKNRFLFDKAKSFTGKVKVSDHSLHSILLEFLN